jgi:WD40 repeat protein
VLLALFMWKAIRLMMRYQGHYISTEYVAWSPHGRYLAITSSYSGIVQVWEVEQGTLVYERAFPNGGYVKVLAWSPDSGSLLLGTSSDGAILWEPEADLDVAHFHQFTINSVWASTPLAWSPDGASLALACGKEVHIVSYLLGETRTVYRGHNGNVLALSWSSDSKHVVSACERGEQVCVWNALSGQLVTSYQGHTDEVLTLAWSPDGEVIASGSRDHTVHVWQPFDGKRLRTYQGSPSPVREVAWSHKERYLAAAYDYDAVHVWEDLTERELRREQAFKKSSSSVAWSPDDQRLAEAGYGALITDAWSGKALACYGNTTHAEVNEVTLNPDGSLVATSAFDGIRIWESHTGEQRFEYHGHDQEVYISELAWSPDGKYMASSASLPKHRCPPGQSRGSVQVWSAEQETMGQQICVWQERSGMLFTLRWSPDSRRLVTIGENRLVRIWDALTGRRLLTYRKRSRKHSYGLCWSPDGAWIASSEEDRVHIWNAATGMDVRIYRDHGLDAQGKRIYGRTITAALDWSPNGRFIASAAREDGLRVWEALSGKTLWIGKWKLDDEDDEENKFLHSYRAMITEVVWSPDSQYILASGGDKTVRVWDVASGEQLFVYKGHQIIVKMIRWFPDSKHVVSTGDGGAHIWLAVP